MEPPELNPNTPDDAALETWLRANAAAAPLPDNGFSARVLDALPPPTRTRESIRYALVCTVGAVAGLLVASRGEPRLADVAPDISGLPENATAALNVIADPALAQSLAVAAGVLVLVFWQDLRRQFRALSEHLF